MTSLIAACGIMAAALIGFGVTGAAAKPPKGEWTGSGMSTSEPPEKYTVAFEVAKRKTVVDFVIENLSVRCGNDGQSEYRFGPIEIDDTDRIQDRDFIIADTIDSGLGYTYEVTVHGHLNRELDRIKDRDGTIKLEGDLFGGYCTNVFFGAKRR